MTEPHLEEQPKQQQQEEHQQEQQHHPPTTNGLFQDSNDAAQWLVVSWMRAALREVALQGIRQCLVAVKQASSASGTHIDGATATNDMLSENDSSLWLLHLTQEDIDEVSNTCQNVAKAWMEQLIQVGHLQAAEWLKNLVELETCTLFFEATDSEEKSPYFNQPESPPKQNARSSVHGSILPYRQIRSLMEIPWDGNPEKEDEDVSGQMSQALAKLNEYGVTAGATCWPFVTGAGSWSAAIEPAARKLQGRLYPRRPLQQTLSLSLPNKNNNADEAGEEEHKSVDWLLQRKRKSRNRPKYGPKRHREQTILVPDKPRCPTDLEKTQWRWSNVQNQMSTAMEEDGENIEKYLHVQGVDGTVVHPDLGEEQENEHCEQMEDKKNAGKDTAVVGSLSGTFASGVLLGNLAELGRHHAFFQGQIDREQHRDDPRVDRLGKNDPTDAEDETHVLPNGEHRQTKNRLLFRQQQNLVKERREYHKLGWDCDYGLPRRIRGSSKVVPTTSHSSSSQQQQLEWIQADLAGGYALLELNAESDGTLLKTFHAFLSVEIMALDHDDPNLPFTTCSDA